ncbi:MAG TPA: GspE/PulE family protein [Gammaproteobacteria bacterium]|jgi:MSHA biogenesis protein MshE|nr:GspE/PulE family protein [Gammaproteobacteria bacterium]
MPQSKKVPLTDMLLSEQLITEEQRDNAILEQKKTDKKIGQILVELGYIEEKKLLHLLSEQLHIPYVDLKTYELNADLVKRLPEFYARHFRSIVLNEENGKFLVGMVDPQDLIAHEEIERILGRKVSLALIREEDLLAVIDSFYRRSEEISHFAESLSSELQPSASGLGHLSSVTTEDMPVVNLLRSIFEDAVQVQASDIHIEPDESVLRIRLRVDGVLQEQIIEEKAIAQALVQRIKMMSGLNIAEKRLPQDGRFSIKIKKSSLDVRVSTLPSQYGETVVMRLLNQSADVLKISQVGMPPEILKYYTQILSASYGLLLLVGPTGSGKTTTLYASLNQLNKPEDKIITVEDPVEYRLPRITQIQVNAQIGLTFANVLRTILRQDPDIVMIGELRDEETMEIAIRAAMTGHFVLSTLHTNDTIGSMTRLLDMGAQGYLLASVLRAIMAQRLVRKICHNCITDDVLSLEEQNWLRSVCQSEMQGVIFKKGSGCTYCHHTGYQGRVGVFELLLMNEELSDALRQSDTAAFQKLAQKQPTYRSLLQSGIDLAVKGITTVHEIIYMSGEI